MAKKNSVSKWLNHIQREAKRQSRASSKAAKEAERATKAYERALLQAEKLEAKSKAEQEKERAKLYVESQMAKTELLNEELEQYVDELENLLIATLSVDDYLDLDTLLKSTPMPVFVFNEPKPLLETYLPEQISGLKKLIPGAKKAYEQKFADAKSAYERAIRQYGSKHDLAKSRHISKMEEIKKEDEKHNTEIKLLEEGLKIGKPEAVASYFILVLENSNYPEDFPQQAKIAYVPESKQLVIEYDLPSFEVVPEVSTYKYNKSKDEITTTARPANQRKTLYNSIVAQIALRTLHELFEADRSNNLETIVFNGYVDTIDKGTGRPVRHCLVTVRTSREIFMGLDLSKVDPAACLKTLNASVSKSAAELVPVRPVLEFNMVDPRFVEETDVLSTLDQRPNLMELSPSEFESLITNLFQKMGLEAKQTQASRDGGVDCVAYDPRPIFGGKVVIQAKRYKHTVGVSAVRDLYGTVQNEGASKGILVTTSGYGKAAFEFAAGKPLELLSGSNLLHLLAEHAGIEAKIEVPDTWKDPVLDSPVE